jgi:hypothetical protein
MRVLRKALCSTGRHAGHWSLPGSRCETVRICDSCGKREEHTHHTWGEFRYVGNDRCEQTRRCERCGATESRSTHEWGPWRYADEQLVTAQVRICRRCHQAERTRRFSTL